MTDLNSLVVFAKVVEANSFSEAARRLKMPISTVSRKIAELEDELGVQLLERSTRSLRLTEIGSEILEHAQRSAELHQSVANIVSNRLTSIGGSLSISVPPSLSESLVSPIVTAFQEAYPNVRVAITVTDRFIDMIEEGVDLAFRLGTLKDSTLMAWRLLTYRHQIVASPRYLEKVAPPSCPSELRSHKIVTFNHQGGRGNSWELSDRAGEKQVVTLQPFLAINDFAGVAHALLNGVGIGFLPPVCYPELLQQGRLVEVMPDWHFPTLDLSLVHAGSRHVPRLMRTFKDFAVQMAAGLFPNLPT